MALYLSVVNVIAFLAYGIDKRKAQKNQWRISEAKLLMLAAIGGSLGAFLGMYLFHHKTKKWKFKLGIPAIMLVQLSIIYFKIFIIS